MGQPGDDQRLGGPASTGAGAYTDWRLGSTKDYDNLVSGAPGKNNAVTNYLYGTVGMQPSVMAKGGSGAPGLLFMADDEPTHGRTTTSTSTACSCAGSTSKTTTPTSPSTSRTPPLRVDHARRPHRESQDGVPWTP